jgi:hypothetical protein
MLSGWQAPNIFSPHCGNNLYTNQFGNVRDLFPQAMFRHGFEDGRSTDQPAYVSHARRPARLIPFASRNRQ